MGQEPNISLGLEDLPRATAKLAPPRRWVPRRPAEIGSPSEMPWGGSFGTPGPDPGYAIRIVRARDLPGAASLRYDVEAAVVAVVATRASALGRAPTDPDVDVAIDLLGLASAEEVSALDGIAHDSKRLAALVGGIPKDQLIR